MSAEKEKPVIFPRDEPTWAIGESLQFPTFEDFFAFDSEMPRFLDKTTDILWHGRVNIRDCFKPPKFYGRIGAITLISIEDPVSAIRDAPQSKINSNGRKASGNILKDFDDEGRHPEALALGFEYYVQALSSSPFKGAFTGLLTYATSYMNPDSPYRSKASILRRYLTVPEVKSDKSYEEYVEESIDRAFKLQRRSMKTPFRGGLPGSSPKYRGKR